MPNTTLSIYQSIRRPLFWGLFIILLMILTSNFIALGDFFYIIWGDREISRSATLGQYFPVSGAELNGREGGRIPGGAIHYLSYLFLSINSSPKFVHMAIGSLALGSSSLLYLVGKKICGPIAGLVAAIIFLTSSYTLTNIFSFWNPLYALPFLVTGFCCFSFYLITRNPHYFLLTIFSMAIATQMHMASLYSAIFLIIFLAVSRIPVPKKTIFFSIAIALLLYSPWILNYAFGWLSEGPSMPAVAPLLLKSPDLFFSVNFELTNFVKQTAQALNAIDFGEPSFLITIFPIGAFLAGIAGLTLGKWPEHKAMSQNISAKQYTYFLIYFITIAALLTGASVELVGNIGLNKHRYYMYLLPAIALLSGIGFSTLLEAILGKEKKPIIYIIFCFLVAAVLARGTITIYSNYKRPLIKLHTSPLYGDIVALAQDINRIFGYGSQKIKHKTSYLLTDGANWYTKIQPIHYLLNYLDLKDSDSPYIGCVFVIGRPADLSVETEFNEETIKKAISNLPLMRNQESLSKHLTSNWGHWGQVTIDTLKIRPKYALVGARLSFSDCPKSFMNPYILSPNEIITQKKLVGQKDVVIADTGQNRIYVRYNNGKFQRDVNLMIKIVQNSQSKISLEIHSKQLRNSGSYLGGYYAARSMFEPSLVFKNLKTKRMKNLLVFPGGLGIGPYTTPWKTKDFSFSPGTYSVWLSFFDEKGQFSNKREILLTNSYQVN